MKIRNREKMPESSPNTREYNNFYDNVNAALDEVVEETKRVTKKETEDETKIQSVFRLFDCNLPIETIAYGVDLTQEEVKQILEDRVTLESNSKSEDSTFSNTDVIEEAIPVTA